MDNTIPEHENDELARLSTEFPGWHIWRSVDKHGNTAAWVATNRRDDGYSPTLHEDTAERLETVLRHPPRGYARPVNPPRSATGAP
ncbi:hypothetical protein [Salinactinospora qingdaonensis]|uniref:Uncharacterized protein n=1 Tax=Salinactinospora qingdaonensis TaxID=702744 RepID=A0ABP7FGH3_9ACTN